MHRTTRMRWGGEAPSLADKEGRKAFGRGAVCECDALMCTHLSHKQKGELADVRLLLWYARSATWMRGQG